MDTDFMQDHVVGVGCERGSVALAYLECLLHYSI